MDTWEKIDSWIFVLPPSRPSLHHLSIIKKQICSVKRDLPVAVLGSTPEFRDLLCELGFKHIYVLEKYSVAYKRMSNLRSYTNKEILVEGDWIDTLPQYQHFFAFILSDLTSGNIPYKSQPRFYRSVSRALMNQGLFIDKILFHDKKKKLSDLEKKYLSLPINLITVNHFSCEVLFCSELLNIKSQVDTTLFHNILRKRFKENIKLLKFLEQSLVVTPDGCKWHYGKKQKDVMAYYQKDLTVLAEYFEEQDSPYKDNLKILISSCK